MDDSPAYHAGIKAGDLPTEVDGTSTEGIDINQLLKLIKGELNGGTSPYKDHR